MDSEFIQCLLSFFLLSLFQLFIIALSFAYFSKALSGTYMKSSITQIERRFDLSSSHTGLIDSSFEIGNNSTLLQCEMFLINPAGNLQAICR